MLSCEYTLCYLLIYNIMLLHFCRLLPWLEDRLLGHAVNCRRNYYYYVLVFFVNFFTIEFQLKITSVFNDFSLKRDCMYCVDACEGIRSFPLCQYLSGKLVNFFALVTYTYRNAGCG
jgi:hypothetical protein